LTSAQILEATMNGNFQFTGTSKWTSGPKKNISYKWIGEVSISAGKVSGVPGVEIQRIQEGGGSSVIIVMEMPKSGTISKDKLKLEFEAAGDSYVIEGKVKSAGGKFTATGNMKVDELMDGDQKMEFSWNFSKLQ